MATTSLHEPDSSAEAGYRHAQYAEALSEFGAPVFLPRSRGWVLRRRVPGSNREDATGCYPIFSCERWDALCEEVRTLDSDLVSLTIVTDPFAAIGSDALRRGFDCVMPFKEHFVVDLKQRAAHPIPRHHRRYAEKALRALDVEFRTAEWGFALGQAHWGTGIFEKTAATVIDFAIETLQVRRLEARSAVENGRGNGALQKIGAVREAVLRKSFLKDGRYYDQVLWSIVADEWRFRREPVVVGLAH